jgi:hypothetical protein
MKRCALCLKPLGLVEFKRWGDLYFCSKAHLQQYYEGHQQDSRVSRFLQWLYGGPK